MSAYRDNDEPNDILEKLRVPCLQQVCQIGLYMSDVLCSECAGTGNYEPHAVIGGQDGPCKVCGGSGKVKDLTAKMREAFYADVCRLEDENTTLRQRIVELESEVSCLRSMLKDCQPPPCK